MSDEDMRDDPPPEEEHPQGIYEGAMEESYEREDDRWNTRWQIRDWIILFIIGVLQFTWMLIVFLFEPGIR